jgi:nucleotide-binding universal stress UspA family protein
MFSVVVIGIDGHQGGRDAIALARQIAPDASFTLAHVATGPKAWWERELAEEIPFHHPALMLAAERQASGLDAGIACVAAASPARGLHEIATRLDANLIVVGSCRHGPLGRVLIGDDARATLAGTPCPVAIAPRGYAELRRASSGLDEPVIERVAHEL